jgi:TFIIF-interacting CTD phosphatase-like protein
MYMCYIRHGYNYDRIQRLAFSYTSEKSVCVRQEMERWLGENVSLDMTKVGSTSNYIQLKEFLRSQQYSVLRNF